MLQQVILLMLQLTLLRVAMDRPMENFPSRSGDGVRWGWSTKGNRVRRGWRHDGGQAAASGTGRRSYSVMWAGIRRIGALVSLLNCYAGRIGRLLLLQSDGPKVRPNASLVPDVQALVVPISYTTKYYL
jgi:hypothetical protein